MPKYKVFFEETTTYVLEVESSNVEEAFEIATDAFHKERERFEVYEDGDNWIMDENEQIVEENM
jgi:hypothetical protein